VNAGARWLDREVVRDGNLITSRGPQDLKPFVREVVKHFAAEAPLQQDEAVASAGSSSPQLNEPPQIALKAMRWMPRPSFRTIALIAFGFALFALRPTKQYLRWSR
jgi:protease I